WPGWWAWAEPWAAWCSANASVTCWITASVTGRSSRWPPACMCLRSPSFVWQYQRSNRSIHAHQHEDQRNPHAGDSMERADRAIVAAFLHEPDGPACAVGLRKHGFGGSFQFDEHLHLSWVVARRN